MGLLIQDDAFPDARLLQRLVELAQGFFRVIPAAALVDADVGVLGTQCLDQLHHAPVPFCPQDLLVVPVQARNEDARVLLEDGFGSGLALGAGDSVVAEVGFDDGPDDEKEGELLECRSQEQCAEESRAACRHLGANSLIGG